MPFVSWKGRNHSSGEADEPHQLEIVRVNELPLINMWVLGFTSSCGLEGGMLCIELRSA